MIRRILISALGLACVIAMVIGAAILFNNYSSSLPPAPQFKDRLDAAERSALLWMQGVTTPDVEEVNARWKELLLNPVLLHMLADCAKLSGNARYASLPNRFLSSPDTGEGRFWWGALVDPAHPFKQPPADYVDSLPDYQRFFIHAFSQRVFQLTAEERKSLFDAELFHRGRLTHQVMALHFYRTYNGSTPQLDRLIAHLAHRIAAELTTDFRVTDLYLQRIVCLLLAGQPHLLKPRWVERALDAQQPDGGWFYAWHGWDPRVFHLRWEKATTAHPTAQGLWLICLLKYRYPKWIAGNFPE